MKNKKIEAAAYHEAGHAVAAWAERVRVTSVTVNDDGSGVVWHANPIHRIRLEVDGSTRARLRAEAAARIALAGYTAQRLHRASSFPSLAARRRAGEGVDSAQAAQRSGSPEDHQRPGVNREAAERGG